MTDALIRLIDSDWVDDYSVAVDAVGDDDAVSFLSVHFGRVMVFGAAATGIGNVEYRGRDLAESRLDDFALAFCGLLRVGRSAAKVLHGAGKTIERCLPTVIIGHDPSSRAAAGLILGRGYRELFRTDAERVFVPD